MAYMACTVPDPDRPWPPPRVLIAAPRGFCAGVDGAIQIVELALERFGEPVYVRHEIVHNRYVVDRLRELGAVFVDELDEVPDDRPVVFSAHGVPKSVPAAAEARNLTYVDATCPLVSKVHRQAERLIEDDHYILFIGHAGHPEVIGTFGQVPPGSIALVETVEDAKAVSVPDGASLAFLTQTTLSVDDTAQVVEALKSRFPAIRAPRSEDICYATSNRQAAVKAIAAECDRLLVIGARPRGRRAAHHQQPHGIDGRNQGSRGAEAAVPGDVTHRQHLRPRRDHALGAQLAAQRLAHFRQETGQECRAVARADRRVRAASNRVALGEGA